MSHLEPAKPGAGRLATAALAALVVALLVGAFWWTGRDGDPQQATAPDPSATASGPPAATESAGRTGADDPTRATRPADPAPSDLPVIPELPKDARVVVVSIDGLASYAVTEELTPVLKGLLDSGAGTLNARTAVEMTVTLPNHTGMVTGRPILTALGGHGVTWNDPTSQNVRSGVDSVFTTIAAAGGESAVFTGKEKFEMWGRSWPGTIDELVVDESLDALTDATVTDLQQHRRDLVFFHIAETDVAGHAHGWGSPAYEDAVRRADSALGQVVQTIEADPRRARETIVVVTADHGGLRGQKRHGDAGAAEDYTIPFVVWGPGVVHGDLYRLNADDYADPGSGQPSYDGPRPVRNASVANLVTRLLGLGAVPGSLIDTDQDLDLR
ncbi:alkaline phosphatase family protein [Nocardioides caeni]|uniref:Alkaline phosphatase family protein n=1 Tax=Nocardioides caeni TaxID=574700 RepID=A0A4S8N3E7_9ACTN|nr:alkaline phosphatase family protein [Nocardioides caeni]THV10508.1 hypothetical protein E9934_14380 [Nocardioides caeni]